MTLDRPTLSKTADWLAVALAASLPWSTSGTSICAALWLLTIIPTLDLQSLRRVVFSPAGGAPLILLALGIAGMLWAEIPWAERLNGVSAFLKLLYIPLLLYHMSRSGRACHVLVGFLVSCALLLILSWLIVTWPGFPFVGRTNTTGVPVKDYISQSAMFTISAFVVANFSVDAWRGGRRYLALALIALSAAFLANVFYVATARTSLVVVPILIVVFGFRLFGWKGAIGFIVGFIALIAVAWPSADYLRERVDTFFAEVQSYRPDGEATSAGERLEFWRKSIGFIQTAPLVGHGTGSIHDQFRRSVVGQTGMAAEAAENPHNQVLAIGIQLGFVGIAALLAMWAAHLALFRSDSFAAWVGFVVVIQNVVSSLFNSHLFDFTHGWAYVIGVGIAGGVVLKEYVRKDERAT